MRSDYLSWDDYFMSVGFLSSMRSKDPSSQVGACIINSEKIIVSIGYNGMPKGCSDDNLPWNKESSNKIETKYFYVCHAEMNAVLNKNSSDVSGCVIYVALFPCNECAKIIIQSRIKEVVYFSDKHKHKSETIASKAILKMAGISVRQYIPNYQTILINFNNLKMDGTEKISLEPEKFSFMSISDSETQNRSSASRDVNKKRIDYIAWEEYFMALAFLSALRSKDPSSQTGACIVNTENKIVGIGYNGMPRGCDETKLPWEEMAGNKMDSKYTYVCHAVMNAILNKNCAAITGCKIYVSLFPCNECAKFIIQAGLKEVIFYSDKFSGTPADMAARRMFDMAGVLYRRYNGTLQDLVINFGTIDWNKEVLLPLTPKDDPEDVTLNKNL